MPQQDPNVPPESIVLSQFAGLKNTVSQERLQPNELERAINVDIDDVGQVRRRRGYTLKDAADYHSVKTVGGKTYGVRSGSLGIIRDDYSFTALQSAGAGAICYTEVDGDVYFSGGISGVIAPDETVSPWGASDQGTWVSPVIAPTDTLGAISGKLLGDPPKASAIEAYKGRIYLAVEKVLWATELYRYHYVDRTTNFMQFEHDITLLMAVGDGLYVGTIGGLYFIQGVFGKFQLTKINDDPVLPGSGQFVPAELVHPQGRNQPVPSGMAAVFMATCGIIAGFDGGTCYNLTYGTVVFPAGVSGASLFRQDQGANSYIAAVDSAGGPSANARIGDYVDAEIIRASQGG